MKKPRPPQRSPRMPVIVTSPIVDTVAIRSPATISGTARGSSTRQSCCELRVAHPGGRLEDVRRHAVEAGHDVADEDHQRVEDERDHDRHQPEPGDRDERGEQRQRRDREEDLGQPVDRRIEPSGAAPTRSPGRTRSANPKSSAMRRQVDVLDGPTEDRADVVGEPAEVDHRAASGCRGRWRRRRRRGLRPQGRHRCFRR